MNARARRLLDIRVVLAVIAGAGLAWFLLDLMTDEEPSTAGDRFARIDAYVRDELNDSRIPGAAIAIVERSEAVHVAGFGNDGHRNAVTADTPFPIGSNTKSVTALATMQLVASGRVDLDAAVQRYLPDFRVADSEASAAITVRHLLNQTSGISRRDGLKAAAAAKDQTIEQAVADLRDLELNRPVGEWFEYANLNSVVLGRLIEVVTGTTWQRYVEERIFAPLEMTRTFTSKEAAEAEGLTATHRYAFGFPFETDGKHVEGLAPTGYVYSTASDLARYLAMYLGGGQLDGQRVLEAERVEEMLAPATNDRTFPLQGQQFTARYGAGWFVGPFGAAQDARWHQGSLPHFTAWIVLLPETDQAVAVLLNAGNQFEVAGANRAWSRIPEGVVNILRDEEPPHGIGAVRFFILFDTVVALVVAVLVWSLIRVARRRPPSHRPVLARVGAYAPLTWEVGLAAALLFLYPVVTGGLGWRATFSFIPDLTLVVLVASSLWLATAVVRAVRLANLPRRQGPRLA